MRLLDLYCKAGGAGAGYAAAGFNVVGVDIEPQPHYPFEFHQRNALDVLADRTFLADFDVIHASPPCKANTPLRHRTGRAYVDLIPQTRAGLMASGLPWVMENVPGARMDAHVILCGTMFGLGAEGRVLRRHRLFEVAGLGLILTPPDACTGRPVGGVYGHGGGQLTRGFAFSAGPAGVAMGIDWMNVEELTQAIPPAYTRFLGEHLAAAVTARWAA